MKRLRHLAALLALLLSPILVRATDINIFPTGPIYKITPALAWGTSTNPGFNNNYFFTPININESVCVFVYNNNPTNAHTFTASIQVTGDPASTGPSTGSWQSTANSSGLSAAVSPGLPAGIGASVTGAAQVSINFSASGTQAGSPDTANVTIIQTTGNCFSGNQFINSSPQSVSSLTQLQTISDGLSQSFTFSPNVSNPAANSAISIINANGGARSLYFDRIVLISTVAATVLVEPITSTGTGCALAAGGAPNLKIGSTTVNTAAVNSGQACSVLPSALNILFSSFPILANTPTTLDLRGVIVPGGSTNGIMVLMVGGITGTISATSYWVEK